MRALPNEYISLGPILTELRALFLETFCGEEDPMDLLYGYYGEGPDYAAYNEKARAIAAKSTLPPHLFNEAVKARVSAKWIDRNHDWCIVPIEGGR